MPRNVDRWYKCNDQPLIDVYLDASPRKPKGGDIICHSQSSANFSFSIHGKRCHVNGIRLTENNFVYAITVLMKQITFY